MRRFYLGQKVRVVRDIYGDTPEWVGKESVIERFTKDRDGFYVKLKDCFYATFHCDELEPLTPPHEACEDAEFIASLDRLAAKVEEMA